MIPGVSVVASILRTVLLAGLMWPGSTLWTSGDADVQMYTLIAADWQFQKQHSPALAEFSGDRQWMNSWPDLSKSGLDLMEKHDRERLRDLERIKPDKLSEPAQLDYQLFRRDLLNRREEFARKAYLTHFWQFERFGPSALRLFPFVGSEPPPVSSTEMEQRVARLKAFPVWVAQAIDLMRQSAGERMLPPQEIVRSAITGLKTELASEPDNSAFFRSFKRAATTLPDAEPALQQARRAVVEDVRPALEQLQRYLEAEYLPRCPLSASLSGWPRGAEFYRFLVRLSTTANVSPETIYEKGLAEVARIRQEMQAASLATSDQRLYCKDKEDLLATARAALNRIEPAVPMLFRRLPQTRVTISPREFGASAPGASYMPPAADGSRPGAVLLNISSPELRPRFEIMALMLHEGMPGHHLQKSLELQTVALRASGMAAQRLRRSDAFSAGWGLYAESLGYEMRMYTDPYDRFGQLSYELMRAVRMVIDTGIHLKNWSHEQARSYFVEQTGRPEQSAEGEVSRAISDPGSLLAYKVGELTLQKMRGKAVAKLGPRFDVREFHEFILGEGSLPLDVWQARFDKWLVERR